MPNIADPSPPDPHLHSMLGTLVAELGNDVPGKTSPLIVPMIPPRRRAQIPRAPLPSMPQISRASSLIPDSVMATSLHFLNTVPPPDIPRLDLAGKPSWVLPPAPSLPPVELPAAITTQPRINAITTAPGIESASLWQEAFATLNSCFSNQQSTSANAGQSINRQPTRTAASRAQQNGAQSDERSPLLPPRSPMDAADSQFAALQAQRPEYIPEARWKEYCCFILRCSYQFGIAPMAAVSGFEGGFEAGQDIFRFATPLSLMLGCGGYFSFWTNFAGAASPDPEDELEDAMVSVFAADERVTTSVTVRAPTSDAEKIKKRVIWILSGIIASTGALASAALTHQSMSQMRGLFKFLNYTSLAWVNYLFSAASGISEFMLGLTEGIEWGENVKNFYDALCGPLPTKDKALLVICGLIIAYLAGTSMIGYAPSVISLISSFAPQWLAQTCGVVTNISEWMFATNLMFEQDREKAMCWHFASPLPADWHKNKMAAACSVAIGLLGGIAMAGFTFAAMNNLFLAYLFAATAWTGGFWMGVEPSYLFCAKPLMLCLERTADRIGCCTA